MHPHRYFDPDPATRAIAADLYARVESLPLVCPHGHVDPKMLATNEPFPDPATLLVIPDHYVTRMLYSQGVRLEQLGIPSRDGTPVETDPRKIWQLFADHYYLYRGTPTGAWLKHEFEGVFGITETLSGANAMAIYDHLEACLARPEFLPRALYERFNIAVLCTTDAAGDTLEHHHAMRAEGWGNVRPTFRPDMAVTLSHPSWRAEIDRIGAATASRWRPTPRSSGGSRPGAPSSSRWARRPPTMPCSCPAPSACADAEAAAIYARALAGNGHRRATPIASPRTC